MPPRRLAARNLAMRTHAAQSRSQILYSPPPVPARRGAEARRRVHSNYLQLPRPAARMRARSAAERSRKKDNNYMQGAAPIVGGGGWAGNFKGKA